MSESILYDNQQGKALNIAHYYCKFQLKTSREGVITFKTETAITEQC